MNMKKTILQLMVVLSLALPYAVYAADDGTHGRGPSRGDRSHEHGERNFDERFQQIDSAMDRGQGFGTPVEELRAGTPRPSDRVFYEYNYYNEVMRDHR